MTDQTSTPGNIRSEMIDVATGFLQNSKIASEQMERKRAFLQKKGLTDTEINHAFQLVPQQNVTQQIVSNQSTSFFYRFLKDLAIAGLLVFFIKLIKRSFHSNQSTELHETVKNLQKSIEDMQTSIVKLEQTTDQLNIKIRTSNMNPSSSAIDEIKQEVQSLKESFLNRSQFPSIPSLRSTTFHKNTTNQNTIDSDNDGIIIISEQDKKSDDDDDDDDDH
ncbi:hypothetical protein I4U23_013815 [Adineta vaga]|nr:hypothetical protein I4U23_013815 [Adineta vaga]